jgi:hypothetical protein
VEELEDSRRIGRWWKSRENWETEKNRQIVEELDDGGRLVLSQLFQLFQFF